MALFADVRCPGRPRRSVRSPFLPHYNAGRETNGIRINGTEPNWPPFGWCAPCSFGTDSGACGSGTRRCLVPAVATSAPHTTPLIIGNDERTNERTKQQQPLGCILLFWGKRNGNVVVVVVVIAEPRASRSSARQVTPASIITKLERLIENSQNYSPVTGCKDSFALSRDVIDYS